MALLYNALRISAAAEMSFEQSMANTIATETLTFNSNLQGLASGLARVGSSVAFSSNLSAEAYSLGAGASNTANLGYALALINAGLLSTIGGEAVYASNAAFQFLETSITTGNLAAFASNTAISAGEAATASALTAATTAAMLVDVHTTAVYASNNAVSPCNAVSVLSGFGLTVVSSPSSTTHHLGIGNASPTYGLDVAHTVRMAGRPGATQFVLPAAVSNAQLTAAFFGGNDGVMYGSVTCTSQCNVPPGGSMQVQVPLGFASSSPYLMTAVAVGGALPCHVVAKGAASFTLQLFNPYAETLSADGCQVDFQLVSPM